MDAKVFRKGVAFASLVLTVLAVTAFSSVARQQQDSSQQSTGDAVADAARKAREQKKKDTTKPKKVYTDEDVSHSVSPTPPVSSRTDASGSAEEGAAKNNPDAQGANAKDASGKDSSQKKARRASGARNLKQRTQVWTARKES